MSRGTKEIIMAVCKWCKGTGYVNCILGRLHCGACATDSLSKMVQKVFKKTAPKKQKKH